jgi:peptidyl-prolyl cis-trans isomerase D
MAVITTIRNKYGKVAGGVIALALVGFIVSDATNGSLASLFSGKDSDVMVIEGKKIDPRYYSERVKEYETLYLLYNQNGRTSLDEAARAQMNEQLVQLMVYETAVDEQCDKIGLNVSDEEKKELVYGMNCDPMIRQFNIEGQQIFNDPQSGQFDPGRIKAFEKELNDRGDKLDPSGKLRDSWKFVKSYVERAARIRKFNALFGNAAYVPKFQMKRMMQDQQAMASVRYVKVPYTAVSDAEVKVTDEDIKAYMQKHEALFKNDEATRNLEYVTFEIVPASADSARILAKVEELKNELTTTNDNETFVNANSDFTNSYTASYFNKRTLQSRVADTVMNMPVGSVYGPYYENGGYNIIKVTDRKTYPDSSKVRHILVRTKAGGQDIRTDSAASMKLDSAIAALKGGAQFDSVVGAFSEDDGSKDKGGEYTFELVARPGLSKEFGDFAFEGKPGETKKVKVSNDNYSGYHYIEILEHKGVGPAVQVALVNKALTPSDSTIDALYGKAVEFAAKNNTAEAFTNTAKKENLDKRIGENVRINSFNINGLGPAREVVRWMYNEDTKPGTVSQVFTLNNERYVVAKLVSIAQKGTKDINPIDRPMLEQKVREEKKAELIAKKYAGKGLDAIAAESMQQVQQSDSVILGGSYVPNLGYEPKVVGYAFNKGFQPNTVSPAIKGQAGVYFITVLSRNESPLPPDGGMMDQILAQQRMQQERQMRSVIDQTLQQAMIKRTNVEYHPDNF